MAAALDQDLQPDARRIIDGGGVLLSPLMPVVSAPCEHTPCSVIGVVLDMLIGAAVVVDTLLPEVEDASLARPRKHGGVVGAGEEGGARDAEATTDRPSLRGFQWRGVSEGESEVYIKTVGVHKR